MPKNLKYFKNLAKGLKQTVPLDVARKMMELAKLITKQISERKSAYSSLCRRKSLSGIKKDGKRAKFFRVESHEAAFKKINKKLAQNAKDFEALYNFFLLDKQGNEIPNFANKKIENCHKAIGEVQKGSNLEGKSGEKLPSLKLKREESAEIAGMINNVKFTKLDKNNGKEYYADYIEYLKTRLENDKITNKLERFRKNMQEIRERWDKNIANAATMLANSQTYYGNFMHFLKGCRSVLNKTKVMEAQARKDRILSTSFRKAREKLENEVRKFDTYEGSLRKTMAVLKYGEIAGSERGEDITIKIDEKETTIDKSFKKGLSTLLETYSHLKKNAELLVLYIKKSAETEKIKDAGEAWNKDYNALLNDIATREKEESKIKQMQESFAGDKRSDDLEEAEETIKKLKQKFDSSSSTVNGLNSILAEIEGCFSDYEQRHSTIGRIRRAAPYIGLVMGLAEKMANLAVSAL